LTDMPRSSSKSVRIREMAQVEKLCSATDSTSGRDTP